ncbi:hypothetical protein J6590_079013 [Homalodisca vitripennis]|nr:hypothetical protein J6590_079013 [Homalodisca vitripennis]
MNSDSDVKLQCRQVAEEFNNYFEQVGYILARAIDSSGPPVVDDNDYTVNTEFSIHTITETELHRYVTSMRGGSAPGRQHLSEYHPKTKRALIGLEPWQREDRAMLR